MPDSPETEGKLPAAAYITAVLGFVLIAGSIGFIGVLVLEMSPKADRPTEGLARHQWLINLIGTAVVAIAAGVHSARRSLKSARDKSQEEQSTALGKLRLAEQLLKNNKPDIAKQHLQEIVDKFPGSDVVGEAQRLLDDLK